jgi:ABC-type transport system involved in cytochrome bd biosynthesis fused ATPase/permease subunit
MKSTASLLLSIVVGVIALILVLKLLGAALKLIGILVVLALVAGVYFVMRDKLGSGGPRG